MVSFVLYGLTYLSVFKILFRSVLSTVYFCFRNYHITDVVFISDNIVSFSFPMKKKYESGNSGALADGFNRFHPVFLRALPPARARLCFLLPRHVTAPGPGQELRLLPVGAGSKGPGRPR